MVFVVETAHLLQCCSRLYARYPRQRPHYHAQGVNFQRHDRERFAGYALLGRRMLADPLWQLMQSRQCIVGFVNPALRTLLLAPNALRVV